MPNVLVNASRARYQQNTGITSKPQPNITGIMGNISPMLASDYATLGTAPEPALRTSYLLIVPTNTDIATGDIITQIYLLDGKTPWSMAGDPITQNVTWWVRYYTESSPGLLSYRSLYLERVQTGGPA